MRVCRRIFSPGRDQTEKMHCGSHFLWLLATKSNHTGKMKLTSVLPALLLFIDAALGFYDAFPAFEGNYTILAASAGQKWIGENFAAYQNRDIIECSNGKQAQDHFDVTSGCLKARNGGPKD